MQLGFVAVDVAVVLFEDEEAASFDSSKAMRFS